MTLKDTPVSCNCIIKVNIAIVKSYKPKDDGHGRS